MARGIAKALGPAANDRSGGPPLPSGKNTDAASTYVRDVGDAVGDDEDDGDDDDDEEEEDSGDDDDGDGVMID